MRCTAGTPAVPAVVISGPDPAAATPAYAIAFFPLPLWLVGLILFVIIAAVCGALYLESP